MELVQKLIDIHNKRERENSVTLYLDGMKIASIKSTQIQSVTNPIIRNERIFSIDALNEDNFINPEIHLLDELIHDVNVECEYSWISDEPIPNRAKRREKPTKENLPERLQKKINFRKGIKSMLGDRNKWN